MRFSVLPVAALVVSFAHVGSAQQVPINPFFGFEYILTPIAVKWACGGAKSEDLARFRAVVAAFPDAAAEADLEMYLKQMQAVSEVSEVVGMSLDASQEAALCAAAEALTVAWLTPERLLSDDYSTGDAQQDLAWTAFFEQVEGL
ncbi:hypothetical protein J7413_00850 [Shimia sp. R10_1]|uniref:hypothetical protein n=1 Tax=Shimia sp. R10_1 TaxID=2821095 RepID=UPI001ADA4CE8|nr:hypothetical protein [Shimia sp. R10_1]MBO9472076.1 hypothetical protein [Shimia sp. R10_1]